MEKDFEIYRPLPAELLRRDATSAKDAAVPRGVPGEIICIDGKRLDTSKAKRRWVLEHHDGSNYHRGELFLSSRGTWYASTPSQWANGRHWVLVSPEEAVESWAKYLGQGEITEILNLANLETE